MKKIFQSTLNEAISAVVADVFPDFALLKRKWGDRLPAATQMYVSRVCDGLTLHVAVIPHPRGREGFFVEIGWAPSDQTAYDLDWIDGFDLSAPMKVIEREHAFFAVKRLQGNQGTCEYSIETPWTGFDAGKEGNDGFMRRFNEEKALKNKDVQGWVQAAVDEAANDLRTLARPFFAAVVKARGGSAQPSQASG